MKNKKTSIIGIIVSVLLAAWGVLQPEINGGAIDWAVIAPALVIAVVGVIQKDDGSWKTSTIGMILAAIMAGASTYQSDPNQWVLIIGSIMSSVGGSLTKDHDK